MRILIVSDYFWPEPSPAAAHVDDRARWLAAQGHGVTVLTSAPNYPEGRLLGGYRNRWRQIEMREGVRVVRVKTLLAANTGHIRRLLDYLSFMISAGAAGLFEKRPEVILSTSPHLFVSVAAAWIAFWRRAPHVMEVRDLWPASVIRSRGITFGVLACIERLLYATARRVIVLSPHFRDDLLSRGVDEAKIDLVFSGAATDLFAPKARRDAELERELALDGRFVVGYPGTLATAHDLDALLDSAKALRGERIVLVIVGGGPTKESFAGRVAAEGLGTGSKPDDLFRFIAAQPRDSMTRWWSLFDCSLALLRDEPRLAGAIPSKIFESMACGVPVIFCGPEGAAADIVRREGVGLCVRGGDGAALAAAVRRLRDDDALRRSFAARCVERAPHWSREKQAQGTLEALVRARS